jgi:hypothetical protein
MSAESGTVTGALSVENLSVDNTENKRCKLSVEAITTNSHKKPWNELNDEVLPKNNKFCCNLGEIAEVDMY